MTNTISDLVTGPAWATVAGQCVSQPSNGAELCSTAALSAGDYEVIVTTLAGDAVNPAPHYVIEHKAADGSIVASWWKSAHVYSGDGAVHIHRRTVGEGDKLRVIKAASAPLSGANSYWQATIQLRRVA